MALVEEPGQPRVEVRHQADVDVGVDQDVGLAPPGEGVEQVAEEGQSPVELEGPEVEDRAAEGRRGAEALGDEVELVGERRGQEVDFDRPGGEGPRAPHRLEGDRLGPDEIRRRRGPDRVDQVGDARSQGATRSRYS